MTYSLSGTDHNAVVLRLIEYNLSILKEQRDAHQRSVDRLNPMIANEEAFIERKKGDSATGSPVNSYVTKQEADDYFEQMGKP